MRISFELTFPDVGFPPEEVVAFALRKHATMLLSESADDSGLMPFTCYGFTGELSWHFAQPSTAVSLPTPPIFIGTRWSAEEIRELGTQYAAPHVVNVLPAASRPISEVPGMVGEPGSAAPIWRLPTPPVTFGDVPIGEEFLSPEGTRCVKHDVRRAANMSGNYLPFDPGEEVQYPAPARNPPPFPGGSAEPGITGFVVAETGERPKFRNFYRHCDSTWEDEWTAIHNDQCPICDEDIEPYFSEDLV